MPSLMSCLSDTVLSHSLTLVHHANVLFFCIIEVDQPAPYIPHDTTIYKYIYPRIIKIQ
jgi:hypothetical protein